MITIKPIMINFYHWLHNGKKRSFCTKNLLAISDATESLIF